MNLPVRISASVVFAFLIAACSGGGLSGSIRTVSVAPGSRQAPQVLAPEGARQFSEAAAPYSDRIAGDLRAAIAGKLSASQRFQYRTSGPADAQIAIEHIRHGLIEVADGLYAVNISGDVTIQRGGSSRGTERDFSGTSDIVRTLAEFENPSSYQQAAKSASQKIAADLVAGL